MKQILSVAFTLLLFAGVAQAQTTNNGQEGSRKHGRGGIYKELNLSAEQQAKIKTIHEAERNEMKASKTGNLSESDKTKRKELHQKYQSQIEAVLTPDQKSKMQELHKKHAGNFKNKEQRYNKTAANLNLSADQKAKMAALQQDFKTKMTTLRNDKTLTAADKKTQMKQLAQTHQATIKALLTPEQISQWQASRKNKPKKNRNEIL